MLLSVWVSMCFLNYQFVGQLIAHGWFEISILCTFAICCHTNWLASSPNMIATERCVYSERPWHCRPPHSQRCLLPSLIVQRAFSVLGTQLSFRAICQQVWAAGLVVASCGLRRNFSSVSRWPLLPALFAIFEDVMYPVNRAPWSLTPPIVPPCN